MSTKLFRDGRYTGNETGIHTNGFPWVGRVSEGSVSESSTADHYGASHYHRRYRDYLLPFYILTTSWTPSTPARSLDFRHRNITSHGSISRSCHLSNAARNHKVMTMTSLSSTVESRIVDEVDLSL